MKTFIYLSHFNRNVYKGLVKTGKFTDLKLLREYVKDSITNYYNH